MVTNKMTFVKVLSEVLVYFEGEPTLCFWLLCYTALMKKMCQV